jgi:hypothetical protein
VEDHFRLDFEKESAQAAFVCDVAWVVTHSFVLIFVGIPADDRDRGAFWILK